MSARSFFRFFSTFTVGVGFLVGLGALYLIERIVPAIDEILNENAYSVSSVLQMQESLLIATKESNNRDLEDEFWKAFQNAQSNVTIEGETHLLSEINALAISYWKGDPSQLPSMALKLKQLADLNLSAMKEKNRQAKTIGLGGAWALGFLILFALIVQLSLQKRLFDSLIDPATDLFTVILDYKAGNPLRRFSGSQNVAKEIRQTGDRLNQILDENLAKNLN